LKNCPPPTEIQLPELHEVPAGTPIPAFQSLLMDEEVAEILTMTVDWVREHAIEIPGFEPLGSYYRFHSTTIEHWLGGLDRVLKIGEVAASLKVPKSWVYANADQIPGVLHLGRYIHFRPSVFRRFILGGSELVQ
jgi:hypothetical protein